MILTVSESASDDELKQVYQNDYVLSAFGELHTRHPIKGDFVKYHSCYVDGIFVGCFLEIIRSPIESEVHSLLFKSAIKHSRELAKIFIKNLFDSKPIFRISTQVMQIHGSVINFCLKIGFIFEGVKQCADMKDGILQSMVMFRILRGEI
ncbi:MAG: hypothetical protein LW839_08580 [Cryomorphaceae bacterium]|jgi:hypothetical protein|nr:hypothetical protein [Cryomorphaceae bacterium]